MVVQSDKAQIKQKKVDYIPNEIKHQCQEYWLQAIILNTYAHCNNKKYTSIYQYTYQIIS